MRRTLGRNIINQQKITMKPIHAVVSKDDLRPTLTYFQVKNGTVWATNCHVLLNLPIKEVFGDCITDTEELYFKGSDWLKFKFHTAKNITRNGLEFSNEKGFKITAIEKKDMPGNFPDAEAVLPGKQENTTDIGKISLNPNLLIDLCKALGGHETHFGYYFYGENKGVIVKNSESAGFGFIMPLWPMKTPEHPFKKD